MEGSAVVESCKSETFGERYFMDGVRSGLSNYEDYKWLGSVTLDAAARILKIMGAHIGDSILDVGCARGYMVRAYKELGLRAWGYDISQWAIENCDPDVRGAVSTQFPTHQLFEYVTLKDIIEHVPKGSIRPMLQACVSQCTDTVLLIMPLSAEDHGAYINPRDNADATHITRWTLPTWMACIQEVCDALEGEFVVSGAYRVPGLKQAAEPYPFSTGFITIKRL